jgi:hypothetical protein
MAFVERNQVVETLPTKAPAQSFACRVRLRRSHRRPQKEFLRTTGAESINHNEIVSATDRAGQHLLKQEEAGLSQFQGISRCSLWGLAVLIATAFPASAQDNPQSTGPQSRGEDKRILWIFTNHRTTDDAAELPPLTAGGKLGIAWDDATDRAIFAQTFLISGLGQLTNSNPSFGQGLQGYAKRFGTTYGDFAIENMTTEGIFPALLHQDPRYFRHREGTARSRLAYAMSRLFITRSDSGKSQFNFSEIGGAATSIAISNAYYLDGRTVGNNLGRYAVQLGFDAASNVLKEFWPDLKRKLPRRIVPR